MEIDRRKLLGAMAGVGLTGLVGGSRTSGAAGQTEVTRRWHPLTRSLLDRVGRAGDGFDRLRVECAIHELADAQGLVSRPVIRRA